MKNILLALVLLSLANCASIPGSWANRMSQMSPEERAEEMARQNLMLGSFNSLGQTFSTPEPTYTRTANCTSYVLGNTIQTDCR